MILLSGIKDVYETTHNFSKTNFYPNPAQHTNICRDFIKDDRKEFFDSNQSVKIFKSRSKHKIILLYGVYRISNIDHLEEKKLAKFCNSSQKIKMFRIIIVNGWRWVRSVWFSSTLRKHNRLYKRWNLFKLIAIGALSTRLNMGMHICSKYEFLVLKLAIIIQVFRTYVRFKDFNFYWYVRPLQTMSAEYI